MLKDQDADIVQLSADLIMKKAFHLNTLSAVLSFKITVYGAKGQDISRQMEDNIRQNRFGRAIRILFPNQTADLHPSQYSG